MTQVSNIGEGTHHLRQTNFQLRNKPIFYFEIKQPCDKIEKGKGGDFQGQ